MKLLFGVILLTGIAAVFAQRRYIDYRLLGTSRSVLRLLTTDSPSATGPTQAPGPTKPTCTAGGKTCDKDCKTIWTCFFNGVDWSASVVGSCNTVGESCNGGSCSKTPTPQCSAAGQKPFECKGEGVFPDPADCQVYHFCVGDALEHTQRKCGRNWAYNPGTTYCSKPLPGDKCGLDYSVPICNLPGQTGPLKDNPSIYYVCSLYKDEGNELYPYLYVCPNGKKYDVNVGCK